MAKRGDDKKARGRQPGGNAQRSGKADVPDPSQAAGSSDRDCPLWSFEHVDTQHEGDWSWPAPGHADHGRVTKIFSDLGKSTWREICDQKFNSQNRTRAKHHPQAVSSLCGTAQKRLAHLGLDQIFADEEMFRFRDGNLGRLWGFRRGRVFYVVWWDSDHKVCPT
jgi:hypothetical protein